MSEQQSNKPERNGGDSETPKHDYFEYATLTTAIIGVIVLCFYTAFAGYQASIAKDTETRQLRAYIGIVPGSLDNFGQGDKQIFHMTGKNYGYTPGYDIGFSVADSNMFRETDIVNIGRTGCTSPRSSGGITMFPSMDIPMPIKGTKTFSRQQLDLVTSGEFFFVYWGTLCYFDAFKRPHYTNYCWKFKGQSMTRNDAEPCLSYNDSD